MSPVISFTYLSLDQITMLEEILSSNMSNIKQLQERYVLFSHEDNKFHHDCPIFELLYRDIEKSKRNVILLHLMRLQYKYGKEIVDTVIIKDDEIIQGKILHIINFAFDKVYKTDTITIRFINNKESSIPDIIYSVIDANFDIINQRLIDNQYHLNIRRRSKK